MINYICFKNSISDEDLEKSLQASEFDNKEYNCLCISSYDQKWGIVSLHNKVLCFTVRKPPEEAKRTNYCSLLIIVFLDHTIQATVLPMPIVQTVQLTHAQGLYKRSYFCQDSALELYYSNNGFSSSIYLFFLNNVLYSISIY
jgi:hypothetical protein